MYVLILEDDEKVARVFERSLALASHSFLTVRDVGSALAALDDSGPFDVLLVDHFLLQGERGDSLLEYARTNAPEALRVLISGYVEPDPLIDDPSHQVFLRKPVSRDALLRALESRSLVPTPSPSPA